MSLLDDFPLRLLINGEDVSFLVDQGMTFSNVDPGGYEAASIPVPKDLPNTIVGQRVRLECGLRTAWEGRIAEVQRSLSARTNLACEGMAARLTDILRAVIFVDRDMSRWSGPSVQRQINVVNAGFAISSGQAEPDSTTGAPSQHLACQQPWGTVGHPDVEIWFDAQGVPIASLYYAWKIGPTVTPSDTNWTWAAYLSTDDVATTSDTSGNLRAAGPGSGTLSFTGASKPFAMMLFNYGAVAVNTSAGQQFDLYLTCLAAYGNNGLTKRGSNTATSAQGFYTSDIARWVAAQVPEIQAGVIPDATGYIVPHASYPTPAQLQEIISDASGQIGYHWGVWEAMSLTGDQRPRLDFCPYPSVATAYCMRADLDELDLNEQLVRLYDNAVVTYTDTTGRTRPVTVTATNPLLQIAGISGRYLPLNGGTMDLAAATAFGQLVLALQFLQARVAGQATSTGTVTTPRGKMPSFLLKAGLDRLRIVDLPSLTGFGSYNDVPISRVEATIGEDQAITTAIDLGTGPNLIETLQARLAEQATILGV